MMMLPDGYPFEQEFKGSISGVALHCKSNTRSFPTISETKYREACTNLNPVHWNAASPVPRASLPLIK